MSLPTLQNSNDDDHNALKSPSTKDVVRQFEARSHAIKVFSGERWGNVPCPLRLVVNPYYSCEHKCAYCYVWSNKDSVGVRKGFNKAILHDIQRGKISNMNQYVVEMSSSTDPLQPREKHDKASLFAINELLKASYKVLIVTKNPCMLLEEEYAHLLEEKNLSIDVSFASLKEGTKEGGILNNKGPGSDEKIAAIKEIIKRGKEVRARIDPVIPIYSRMKGQTENDLVELVEALARIGVKLIITKTMRLSKSMPQAVVNNYLQYYKENGELMGSTYILSKEKRRAMLEPIQKSCKKNNMLFCPCCDADVFTGEEIATCAVEGESKIMLQEVIDEHQKE